MNRIALVTGGNRGIGLAVVKGLAKEPSMGVIIFTSRSEPIIDGKSLLDELFQQFPEKKFYWYPLDCEHDQSCKELVEIVLKDHGYVDILVNNAGILLDNHAPALQASIEHVRTTFQVNTLAPIMLSQGFVSKMKERNYGRIINMSSALGALTDMQGGNLGYRMSKASLNVLTKTFAEELKDTNILVNSMSPGFVKTDMTGGEKSLATKTPEEGADTAIWLATLPDNGIRGKFIRDRKEINF